jgi:Na+/H+-dicarboxylate symporter
MYAAPIGAFGAMAFAIGKYGIGTLTSLFELIMTFHATSLFFVLVVLGLVAAYCGINIFKLLRYLKEELLIVLGTSSSESVLPQLMKKLEHLQNAGCYGYAKENKLSERGFLDKQEKGSRFRRKSTTRFVHLRQFRSQTSS